MKMDPGHHILEMIETIRRYGLRDETILDAMASVPRHSYVDMEYTPEEMYGDHPLLIGEGQTISQPYTVAFMLSLLDLKPKHNVLEIGTGSGWNAAIIKKIVGDAGKLTSVELKKGIADRAKKRLKMNDVYVDIINKDGSYGYEKNAPYDRIIVTCASPKIFNSWKSQLKDSGIIVAPIGRDIQQMVRYEKKAKKEKTTLHGSFAFVPLLTKKID